MRGLRRSVGLMTMPVVGAVACFGAAAVSGQGAVGTNEAQAQTPYTAPRTPDGHPDLQGFWTNQTYTPLERPDGVTKPFYTEEEAAAIEQGRAEVEISQTVPGTVPDVHYDFTQFGLDRSQSAFARNLRTSLIVDPPNGKLPPVTAEGVNSTGRRNTLMMRCCDAETETATVRPRGSPCDAFAWSAAGGGA